MRPLKENQVNESFSLEAFEATRTMVRRISEFRRGYMSEEYYIHGIITVGSIKHGTCTLSLFDEENNIYEDQKRFDLSFLPPLLWQKARKSSFKHVHVLVCKKISINSTFEDVKTTLIVPIGQKQIGYASNDLEMSKYCAHRLKTFHDNSDEVYGTIPFPRYSQMKRLRRRIAATSLMKRILAKSA